MSNPYYSGVRPGHAGAPSPNLTLNFGLRYEYENGIKEAEDAGSPGSTRTRSWRSRTWRRRPTRGIRFRRWRSATSRCSADRSTPAPLAAPRRPGRASRCGCRALSAPTSWASRTVVKGGYGLFYDTLNAADYGRQPERLQRHDDQRGQHGLRPDLAARRSEERHLAARQSVPGARQRQPVRARRLPIRSASTPMIGTRLQPARIPNRQHARVQRWRIGVQRELFAQHGGRSRVLRLVRRPIGILTSRRSTCRSSITAA